MNWPTYLIIVFFSFIFLLIILKIFKKITCLLINGLSALIFIFTLRALGFIQFEFSIMLFLILMVGGIPSAIIIALLAFFGLWI